MVLSNLTNLLTTELATDFRNEKITLKQTIRPFFDIDTCSHCVFFPIRIFLNYIILLDIYYIIHPFKKF